MGPHTKLHDGIIGVLLVVGALLSFYSNIAFVLILGAIGVVMIQSAITGFCPIYYTLGKMIKK